MSASEINIIISVSLIVLTPLMAIGISKLHDHFHGTAAEKKP